MPFVQRLNGAISGVFANAQPGYAEEFLDPTDPTLLAFFNPPPTPEQLRVIAVKANARRQALVTAIQNSDDAQLITYVNNNVTDLASAKVMLANLALLVAGVIRS